MPLPQLDKLNKPEYGNRIITHYGEFQQTNGGSGVDCPQSDRKHDGGESGVPTSSKEKA
jgi:hypothetical protein